MTREQILGVVRVKAKKDIPFFASLKGDNDGKLQGEVKKDGKPLGLTWKKKDEQFIMTSKKAGLFARSGYVDILNENKEVVKINVKPKS